MPEEETNVQQAPAQVNPAPANPPANGAKPELNTPVKNDQPVQQHKPPQPPLNGPQKNNQQKQMQNNKNINQQNRNGMVRAQSAHNVNGQHKMNKNNTNQGHKRFNQNQNFNQNFHQKNMHGGYEQQQQQQGEKKFTGRCRLFVGNLPAEISEQEFKDLFTKFGETGEAFLNTQRSFGFIKLDTRLNAEHAKQELDGFTFKGRCIRVRFASHGAAVRVKNLSPFVSNEYLEQAFSTFGRVERAVVIVDDKGRPTGEGIVEFERKPSASQCLSRCSENCFILTSYPKPVIVEPLDQKDDEDGLPEKSIMKNHQYHSERETAPHFAQNSSLELELAMKWRDLYELEKQVKEEGEKKIQEAREQLEYEIEVRLIDYKELKIKEDLRAKQEELQRIDDMRKSEFQRRKEMEINRNMMMNQHGNQRMPQQGNGQNFEQPLINQPPMMQNGPNNRRFDQSNGFQNQNMNQMPQQQQQAMLAAQLSAFAMAANMNMNGPMFEQGQQQGMQMPNQGNQRGGRNFNRRGGGNMNRGPHREDQSPFPGYENKRARY